MVLVDDDGNPVGTAEKSAVHGARTPRHLAFSCYGFDADGRLLVTRRARDKVDVPGRAHQHLLRTPGAGRADGRTPCAAGCATSWAST